MTARTDFVAGARRMAPLVTGAFPFAFVVGVTAVQTGFTPLQTVAMSVVVFAGPAQLAAIDLMGRTAPVAVVLFTVVVINLRFLMYSASIALHFRPLPRLSKLIGAYLLTDQAYAVSIVEFRTTSPVERSRAWFFLGAGLVMWSSWQLGTVGGVVVGTAIPDGIGLEFVIPLMFMALLFPAIEDGTLALVAAVTGVVSAAGAILPYNLGLLIGALAGVAAGVIVDVRRGEFPVRRGVDTGGSDGGASP